MKVKKKRGKNIEGRPTKRQTVEWLPNNAEFSWFPVVDVEVYSWFQTANILPILRRKVTSTFSLPVEVSLAGGRGGKGARNRTQDTPF